MRDRQAVHAWAIASLDNLPSNSNLFVRTKNIWLASGQVISFTQALYLGNHGNEDRMEHRVIFLGNNMDDFVNFQGSTFDPSVSPEQLNESIGI